MRTNYCGEIDERYLEKTVTIQGWVHRRRDHGGVIFIDLRDRAGLVQVVCDPQVKAALEVADKVRNEFVLQIQGSVRHRPEGTKNDQLKTGAIEIWAQHVTILNPSLPPPFLLDDEHLSETVRLTHRVLDLRRAVMQRNLMLRYRVAMTIRQYLDQHGFLDIETPMLTKSTPEGARDYLVPSRVHAGQFFALPQSPQLFKQMLMIAGFDRYYQITKCFRDEDLRADRQPEFTQIDIETSFLQQEEIMQIMEGMIRELFSEVLQIQLPNPFPRLSFQDAMTRYGSDKPDLRISLELTELTEAMKNTDFKVFREAANRVDGRVAALRVPQGASLSRSEIDAHTQFVAIYGAKGLAYIKVNSLAQGAEGLQSPIVKFLSPDTVQHILHSTHAQDGDLIYFGADHQKTVADALGGLRLKLGHEFGARHGYFTPGWQPLWVVDFPMFEYDAEGKRWVALHHPFTAPQDGHETLLDSDPGAAVSKAYDMVLNGWEIGGGSVRIHQEIVQSKVFRALHIDAEEAQQKFGFLLDALQYGAPPHGGMAFGLDRIVTLMAGAESIRDVIAFPKTQRAQCLLTQAPDHVSDKQLKELHLKVV